MVADILAGRPKFVLKTLWRGMLAVMVAYWRAASWSDVQIVVLHDDGQVPGLSGSVSQLTVERVVPTGQPQDRVTVTVAAETSGEELVIAV